jgi:hypothetical protein
LGYLASVAPGGRAMPLRGVRYRVKTYKSGKPVRPPFQGKRVVETKALAPKHQGEKIGRKPLRQLAKATKHGYRRNPQRKEGRGTEEVTLPGRRPDSGRAALLAMPAAPGVPLRLVPAGGNLGLRPGQRVTKLTTGRDEHSGAYENRQQNSGITNHLRRSTPDSQSSLAH